MVFFMHCDIYKFSKKDEMYAYIARPNFPDDVNDMVDALGVIPDDIRNTLGRPSFVMHLDLATRKHLARVNIDDVKEKLTAQGYFLQFPPDPNAPLDTSKYMPFSAVDC